MNRIIIICLSALVITNCQCQRVAKVTPKVELEQSIVSTDIEARYMIVSGAYRQLVYAERKVKDLEQKGYPASIVNFKNGVMAVVICPSDNLEETTKKLGEVHTLNFSQR